MRIAARRLVVGVALVTGSLVPAAAAAQTSCDPSYPDFCIAPAWEVGDLDCADIGVGWFTVIQPDGHGFDADYDGYGCESY